MDTEINEESENQVIFQIRNVFGLPKIYPHCPKAKAFAHLAGKKTLSPNDLKDISYLGFLIWFENVPTKKYYKHNHDGFVRFQKFLDNWNG